MELHRIELPNAVFSITVIEDKVRDTPPIAKWANGLSWSKVVRPYYLKKGYVDRLPKQVKSFNNQLNLKL
jgi:hypothetical protein